MKFLKFVRKKKKITNSNKIFNFILISIIRIKNLIKPLFVVFVFIIFCFLFKNKTNDKYLQHSKYNELNIKENIKHISSINKTKSKDYDNSTVNRGFLKINTIHKGKFTHYDYISNIILYKDIYKDITYTPITEKNAIKEEKLISKEEYCKLCEEYIKEIRNLKLVLLFLIIFEEIFL